MTRPGVVWLEMRYVGMATVKLKHAGDYARRWWTGWVV